MGQTREREWFIFTQNRAAVLAALERGECDGVLPAARGFLDGFAEFGLESGVLNVLDTFPDPRERRSIPMFFFCNTLIHRSLFQLRRLAPIERTLFRSPYILRQLGFNARQVEEGFYDTQEGAKPFTVKALTEAFARTQPGDYLANQKEVLRALWSYCPGEFRPALWAMDSVHIHLHCLYLSARLAVYAGPHFALLLPSELIALILANIDAWQANRDQLILALRLCEGHT